MKKWPCESPSRKCCFILIGDIDSCQFDSLHHLQWIYGCQFDDYLWEKVTQGLGQYYAIFLPPWLHAWLKHGWVFISHVGVLWQHWVEGQCKIVLRLAATPWMTQNWTSLCWGLETNNLCFGISGIMEDYAIHYFEMWWGFSISCQRYWMLLLGHRKEIRNYGPFSI